MSFGRDMQKQSQDASKDASKVAAILGFIGSSAAEMVTKDIEKLLDRNMLKELDGYVLAISKIMKHEIGWQCIVEAFAQKGKSIPQDYFKQFNMEQKDIVRQRPTVS